MTCSFCDFWSNPAPKGQELTTAEYARLADELAELGTFLVSIEGGEPLIRPDLLAIVRSFAAHHLPTLFTNGWMVNAENARAFFDAGLTHACVSIDYPDAKRHDAKRGLDGGFARALRALEHFRAAAPAKERQVHVMTVLMDSNWTDLEALVRLSAEHGVGHQFTLLSTAGYRRGHEEEDRLPPPEAGDLLVELHERYPHVRIFRGYARDIARFLRGQSLPVCRAGSLTFNIDHVGSVAPCIEKIDRSVGNLREYSLRELLTRLRDREAEVKNCTACYTACRGFVQQLEGGGSPGSWRDLSLRMRSR